MVPHQKVKHQICVCLVHFFLRWRIWPPFLVWLPPHSAIFVSFFGFPRFPVYRPFLSRPRNLNYFFFGEFSLSFHFCVVLENRALNFDTFIRTRSSWVLGHRYPPANNGGVSESMCTENHPYATSEGASLEHTFWVSFRAVSAQNNVFAGSRASLPSCK